MEEIKLTKGNVEISKITDLDKSITNMQKIAKDTEITDQSTFEIAKGNMKTAKDLKTKIDDARKELGNPYNEIYKYINTTAKPYLDKIELVISTFNAKVVSFSNLAAAQIKITKDEKIDEAIAESQILGEHAEMYLRVRSKMYAMLIGGEWEEKDGTKKRSDGCMQKEQVAVLLGNINKGVPGPEAFGEFGQKSRILLARFGERSGMLVDIIGNPAYDNETRDDMFATLKHTIAEETAIETKEIAGSAARHIKVAERTVKAELKDATKGMRTTLHFTIINEGAVSAEFLSVDDKKVRAYFVAYREEILAGLKAGKQPIDGLNVYAEQKMA